MLGAVRFASDEHEAGLLPAIRLQLGFENLIVEHKILDQMNKQELIEKWKLKKIATQMFIKDECDNIPKKDKDLFSKLMDAIFLGIIQDLQQLNEESVKRSEKKTKRCKCGTEIPEDYLGSCYGCDS